MSDPDATVDPDPVIEAYKADVDRTLLRRNLAKTPSERLAALEEMAKLVDAAARARRARDASRSE